MKQMGPLMNGWVPLLANFDLALRSKLVNIKHWCVRKAGFLVYFTDMRLIKISNRKSYAMQEKKKTQYKE